MKFNAECLGSIAILHIIRIVQNSFSLCETKEEIPQTRLPAGTKNIPHYPVLKIAHADGMVHASCERSSINGR
jgi:hypothetical protein